MIWTASWKPFCASIRARGVKKSKGQKALRPEAQRLFKKPRQSAGKHHLQKKLRREGGVQ